MLNKPTLCWGHSCSLMCVHWGAATFVSTLWKRRIRGARYLHTSLPPAFSRLFVQVSVLVCKTWTELGEKVITVPIWCFCWHAVELPHCTPSLGLLSFCLLSGRFTLPRPFSRLTLPHSSSLASAMCRRGACMNSNGLSCGSHLPSHRDPPLI